MKKILIIGGCGYIGSALFNKFKNKHHVNTVDLEWFGNYVNPSNIKIDFDTMGELYLSQFDVVIHVAAHSSVPLCKDVKAAFNNNVSKFVNLAGKLKKQKFIYASSSCVYVTSDNKPKVETDTLFPMDGLTLTKTTIDQYMSLTDVEYYGLRFGSVNGWSPNMRLDLMINAMTLSAKTNHEVNVMNGDAHRPILSINDLCRAVEAIVDCDKDHRGVYNLASVNHDIKTIGGMVAERSNVPVVDKGNNYTYDFMISSEKFKKTFNFEFEDVVSTIVDNINQNEINPKWTKRELKDVQK